MNNIINICFTEGAGVKFRIANGDEYFLEYGADELRENYNTFHNEISQIDRSDILYLW